ncbi:hypothetical protein BpHYR1_009094 [Brachionus plicatilis]|uniref:Uncharacterized protein n=1 Tax=Brachionus plicatilis TaxID=10195 RepID=A0A3M7QMF1_BRAPC|nr:hypothetical protein BpHYR1_009094 [Brachionus plicatilis]
MSDRVFDRVAGRIHGFVTNKEASGRSDAYSFFDGNGAWYDELGLGVDGVAHFCVAGSVVYDYCGHPCQIGHFIRGNLWSWAKLDIFLAKSLISTIIHKYKKQFY